MAKAIKRVGVIFLAVAIICLMAIGVILGTSYAKNSFNFNESLLDLDNKVNEANDVREGELPPIVEEVFLDGTTCDEQAEKWKEAMEKSLANGGNQHILVTMKNDWVAKSDVQNTTAFGNWYYFFDMGRICIPVNAMITLDLNGHTIDRALTIDVVGGEPILVYGTLKLKDSKYKSVDIQNLYFNNPSDLSFLDFALNSGAGMITGGKNSLYSGGLSICDTGKFYMYGGLVYGNSALLGGGGICAAQTTHVKIYDGIIANNSSDRGGGMYIAHSAKFDFYDGFVVGNKSLLSGGGLFLADITMNATIYGGVIAQNTSNDDGGGIFAIYTILNIYGGIIDRNIASGSESSCGGGICGISPSAILNISGAKITNNECSNAGAGIFNTGSDSTITISDTIITGNIARLHPGVTSNPNAGGIRSNICKLRLGAGCLIYNNYANGSQNNVALYSTDNPIEIYENLLSEGKAFRVGITSSLGTANFTTGFKATNPTLSPNMFFLADNGNVISTDSDGEAIIGTTANTAQGITWKWGTGANQSALNYAEIPYTGQTYTISAVITGTSTNVPIVPVGRDNCNITLPGSYSFYTTSNYRSPTFQIKILEPKEKVAKPTAPTDNAFIYGGVQQTYVPQGFDSSKMEIAYNRETEPGQYTATVKLKDAWNTTWADGSTGALTYTYKIIRDSVIGANSEYDYVYKDNENKRQNYTDNKVYHKYNDNSLNIVNGTPRYVIGNINANTSVRDFITNLKSEDITKVKLFDSNGALIYNGATQSSSYDTNKTLVQTGWYLTYNNYYGNTETIYLSVLGDVVADGTINTLDITYINRIAKGEIALSDLSLEQQLAAMVDNKGTVTSTDGKILLNVIGGDTKLESYFENVAQEDKYQILVLNSTSGKTYRQNMNLTTLNVYDNAIIGNIAPNTKASEFKTKLATQTSVNASAIAICKANGAIASDNDYIGTGYYISYAGKTIYLSVLGDLTGDGIVNTMDVTYLNRIINGDIRLSTSDTKEAVIMLAAIIQNKGNLTTADSETLLNYIGGIADMTKYY